MGSPRDHGFDRHVVLALTVLAVLYAALAGLRTVGDFDLGWQLATGRHVVEHRQIPSTDVFSYTARGREWIYPPFSGVLFYVAYLLGGFAALSWLSAAACAGTVGLLLRRGGLAASPGRIGTAALAIMAAPAIAFRTVARAELFSTALFAAFLTLLWQHYRSQRAPLWLLPALMLAWINLHLGFIAGLALVGGYVAMELLELPFAGRRLAARARLRQAAPWLAATVAATVVNPWGPRIYAAIVRQNRILKVHSDFVGEWSSLRLSTASLAEALAWRSPDSAYWWLLGAALLAFAVAVRRKQFGPALLLAGAAFLSARYVRFQALFAMVAVVVAGSFTAAGDLAPTDATAAAPAVAPPRSGPRLRSLWSLAVLAVMVWLVGVRVSDLVSNRYYLSAGEISVFGPGASWWYPERACAFLLRERLPGQVFHDYNLGGYLTWRIGPQYPVYLDGRAVPFGAELFFRHRALMQQPPESPEWQREADRRGINTLIFSVARYAGLGSIPLQLFCESQAWRPVYLDEVAVIFLRNRPENAAWLERLQIDCAKAPFTPPASRNTADLYNFHANAGSVLYMLARDAEAFEVLERAQKIFPHDANLRLTKGQLFQATDRIREAEQEYQASVRLKETDASWYALGRVYAAQGRYPEAARAIQRAAQRSLHAYDRYRALGQVYLAMNQPQNALLAFEDAVRLSPFQGEAAPLGAGFQAQVAAGQARAWRKLGDLARAVTFQEQAVEYAPRDPARWLELAELYQAQGRSENAQRARRRAESLRSP